MKRRKNNEGSWGTKTINSKKYVYFKKTYIFFDGNTEEKYFYGSNTTEVNDKRTKYEECLNQTRISKSPTPPQITFGQYMENWFYSEKPNTVQAGTFDGYETAIRVRIKNFKGYDLWNKQLSQINSNPAVGINIFKSYIDALRDHGYALKTIKEVATLISQCCAYASNPMRNDLAYNYMDYVTLPTESAVKKHKREIHFMSEREMQILYNEAKRVNSSTEGGTGPGKLAYSNNGYAIILIMNTGLRVSELCALKREDIDLKNKRIWVHRSFRIIKVRDNTSKNKTKLIEKETKTVNGRRYLPITSKAMEAITYFLNLPTNPQGYLCINKEGTPIRRERLWRSLNKMLENAGLRHYSIHELRHSFGSILLEKSDNQDRAIAAISRILGHANISITYNIYIHVLDSRLTATFEILDNDVVEKAFTGADDLENDEAENVGSLLEYKKKYEDLVKMLKAIPNIN